MNRLNEIVDILLENNFSKTLVNSFPGGLLVDEMIKQDIGQRPYKIEKYLNNRFSEYPNCLRLAESNNLTPINTGSQLKCN